MTIAGAVLLSGGFSAATLGAYFLIAAATQPPDPTERDDPRRLYGGLALAFAAVELAAGAPLLAVGLARRTRRVVLTPTFGPTPSGAIGGVHLRF
ncbi:MAG: hypothetical protein KC636_36045 [Myxococcales bacterium]|nr:hypothetical protein [Myxococcales bacterium]